MKRWLVAEAAPSGCAERSFSIAILEGCFGAKVNLVRPLVENIVPDEVDGVPVIVDIVGPIVAL